MNVRINQLVKSLLQKDSIEQCSIEELQEYAEKHPYFGAAQLLLAKKMKAENVEQYNEQLQKTYLFFHNPLWVEALLNETGNAVITAPEQETVIIKEVPVITVANFQSAPNPEISVPLNNEIIFDEENNLQEIATIPEPVNNEIAETNEPVVENTINIIPLTGEINTEETVTMETVHTEEPVVEKLEIIEEEPIIIPALKIETIDPATAELSFEPYHTVDYFASQGIKFKEEDKPKDKFGQQLKSFTAWLKTMKRLPVSEIIKNTNASAEQKVEQMAEHSLETKEVLTEAMAEVWEKQGNKEKAIGVYTKLSLLEPSKSIYFATKIEDIKKTNQT
jgi:hypothetical protein